MSFHRVKNICENLSCWRERCKLLVQTQYLKISIFNSTFNCVKNLTRHTIVYRIVLVFVAFLPETTLLCLLLVNIQILKGIYLMHLTTSMVQWWGTWRLCQYCVKTCMIYKYLFRVFEVFVYISYLIRILQGLLSLGLDAVVC